MLGTAAYMSPEQARTAAGRAARPTSSRSASCSTRWPPGAGRSSAPSSVGVLAAILSEQPDPARARSTRRSRRRSTRWCSGCWRRSRSAGRRRARSTRRSRRCSGGTRTSMLPRAGGAREADDGRPRGRARASCAAPIARVRDGESLIVGDHRRAGHRQDQPGRGLPRRARRRGRSGRSSRAAAARSGWPAPRPTCRSSRRSTACCTAPAASRCRR